MMGIVKKYIGTGLITMAGVLGVMGMSSGDAWAERTPARTSEARATKSELSTYHKVIKVVRNRSTGKSKATFYAEPQLLDENAVAIVSIRSIASDTGIERFRCVATHDIAECLGTPVKIKYLPLDTKVVLEIQLVPRGLDFDRDALATLH